MGAKFFTFDGGFSYKAQLETKQMGESLLKSKDVVINYRTMRSDKAIVVPHPGNQDVALVKSLGKNVTIGFNINGMLAVFEEDGETLDTIAANVGDEGEENEYMFCEADILAVKPGQFKAKLFFEDKHGNEQSKIAWIKFSDIDVIEAEASDEEEEADEEDLGTNETVIVSDRPKEA